MIVFDNKKQIEIIKLYSEGLSLRDISKKYFCSVQAIYSVLKKNNISRRNNRKYSLDENFFNIINTQEKAYILGLFYADGYNTNKELCLKLFEPDLELIENIKNIFQSNRPLRRVVLKNKNHFNQVVLELSSVYLCKQAANLGIEKNKTFKIVFPEFLEQNLIQHFIRGYFDGDGCIYYNKKTNNLTFTIIGTEKLCKSIQEYFLKKLDVNSSIIKNKRVNEQIKILSIGGNLQIKKVMDFLYKNSNIHMKRKWLKYTNFLDLIKKNDKRKNSIKTQFKPGHLYQKH